MAEILTYYSFKGGSGRSMLLANAAFLLASQSKKVLAVDWDLEAPSLHYYFRPFIKSWQALQETEGVTELLHHLTDVADERLEHDPDESEALNRRGEEAAQKWFGKHENRIISLVNPFQEDGPFPYGRLDLLTAGRQDEGYADSAASIDWDYLIDPAAGRGILEALRSALKTLTVPGTGDPYDYILIDSRTGMADSAGVCTQILPDKVVLCVAPNRPSIQGARLLAQGIRGYSTDIGIYPVPMRLDRDTERFFSTRAYYQRQLGEFLPDEFQDRQDLYWDNCVIEYYSLYSVGERLSVMVEAPGMRGTMLRDIMYVMKQVLGEGGNDHYQFQVGSLKRRYQSYYQRDASLTLMEQDVGFILEPAFPMDAKIDSAKELLRKADEGEDDYDLRLASALLGLVEEMFLDGRPFCTDLADHLATVHSERISMGGLDDIDSREMLFLQVEIYQLAGKCHRRYGGGHQASTYMRQAFHTAEALTRTVTGVAERAAAWARFAATSQDYLRTLMETGSLSEVVQQADRLIKKLSGSPVRKNQIDLLLLKGDALKEQKEYRLSRLAYREAARLAKEANEDGAYAKASLAQGEVARLLGVRNGTADNPADASESSLSPERVAELSIEAAQRDVDGARLTEAEKHLERARKVLPKVADDQVDVPAYQIWTDLRELDADLAMARGDWGAAVDIYNIVKARYERAKDMEFTALTRLNQAFCCLNGGDFEQARRLTDFPLDEDWVDKDYVDLYRRIVLVEARLADPVAITREEITSLSEELASLKDLSEDQDLVSDATVRARQAWLAVRTAGIAPENGDCVPGETREDPLGAWYAVVHDLEGNKQTLTAYQEECLLVREVARALRNGGTVRGFDHNKIQRLLDKLTKAGINGVWLGFVRDAATIADVRAAGSAVESTGSVSAQA